MTTIKQPGWFFYPSWIILTALCFPATFFLYFAFIRILFIFIDDIIYVNGVRHVAEDYLAMYFFIPVIAILTGLLQYWLLKRYLPRMGGWVWVTLGGWLLGVLLILIPGWLNLWPSNSRFVPLGFITIGFSISVVQWLLLRQRVSQAGWWIVANAVGWGLLGLISDNAFGQFDLFVFGLLPACVTAAMLAVLLNRTQLSELQ